MNKKAQIKLHQFLIGFLVFSLIITMGVSFIGSINEDYGLTMSTSEFNKTYTQINKTLEITDSIRSKTIDADISESESWESMGKGAYSSVRLLANTFSTVNAITNDIAKVMGIPQYIVSIGISALLISLLFAIIFLVMGVVRR